jgi:hypothetical protein
MSQFRWRAIGRFVSKDLLACGGLLAILIVCVSHSWLVGDRSLELSDRDQQSLVGGSGPNYDCTGRQQCDACVRPVTCTPVMS